MHDYTGMRKKLGYSVNQTLDAPIMLFEIWELSEVFVSLGLILIFGIIFYEWLILCILLSITLVGLPYLRKHFNKGIAFHYPYQRFGMHLPGLANPSGRTRVSD